MENNKKFRDTIYCVPPLFLHDILKRYGHNYIDATTGLPYQITTMPNLDALGYFDRNKIKSAPFSNVLDQMRVHAWARTLFPNMTRNVASHSLFDCGVYVLKYMEIVNPSLLKKRNFTVPLWTKATSTEKSSPVARHQRPFAALQSPYVQLKTADLESSKLG
ncbi:hypothetical protein PIB30_069925 [Stylosanthes scabra]|uniref:Ubiquitin-like protease family profile domain-containing protein n=1 Tax=Stylosanthes scabra TaxID=79078 RepID=A0ABU6SPE4_9FABA|nr:hypothetical protein [Stylosanthes scabra]